MLSFLKMGFKKFKAHLDGYICSEKIMLTNLSKMSSKVCPKIFMYSPMISSGPGAFPPLRLLRASCSSFGVIILSRVGSKLLRSPCTSAGRAFLSLRRFSKWSIHDFVLISLLGSVFFFPQLFIFLIVFQTFLGSFCPNSINFFVSFRRLADSALRHTFL